MKKLALLSESGSDMLSWAIEGLSERQEGFGVKAHRRHQCWLLERIDLLELECPIE